MKTTKVKKVLIALDYDISAQQIAKKGFALAKSMNAQTVLLHVISDQPAYYSAYEYMQELQVNILPDLIKSTQHFLDKSKKLLGDDTIQTVLKKGETAEMILNTANELAVDVIVMGSHSRSWFDSIMLGSEAANVLKKTTLPLYIIPTKNREI